MTSPASVYALAASFVTLHLVFMSGLTGAVRARTKSFPNPEDNRGEATLDHPDVLRVKRAHQNLLENAIFFYPIGALYVATGPSTTAAIAYFGTFVAARAIHTIVYLRGMQPWRTMAYGVGVLAVLGMMFHVVRAAL